MVDRRISILHKGFLQIDKQNRLFHEMTRKQSEHFLVFQNLISVEFLVSQNQCPARL